MPRIFRHILFWILPAVAPGLIAAPSIERPLRYQPDGKDFVITNGAEFFDRPLYGTNTAFRVDAGDRPEFSLYLPGRGGNLRVGIVDSKVGKWLADAASIVSPSTRWADFVAEKVAFEDT